MSRKNKVKKKKTVGDHILTIVLIVAICIFCYAAFNPVSYTHLTLPTILRV